MLFDRMGIDVWEVIEAAKTKPFGFHAVLPRPRAGRALHPHRPFYLSWKATRVRISTRFIELAGEINTDMPDYVVRRLDEALNDRGKGLKGSKILVLGMAYKKDIDDMRESPALEVIKHLRREGREGPLHRPVYSQIFPRSGSTPWTWPPCRSPRSTGHSLDAVMIITDHSAYDYAMDREACAARHRHAQRDPCLRKHRPRS